MLFDAVVCIDFAHPYTLKGFQTKCGRISSDDNGYVLQQGFTIVF
jgi:hypothetical protein